MKVREGGELNVRVGRKFRKQYVFRLIFYEITRNKF